MFSKQSLSVGLSFLFDLRVKVAREFLLGNVPSFERRLYFGAAGSFSGPGLTGKLIDGGDWLQVRDDGVIVQDVSFCLKTDDGALIAYRHRGLRHESKEVTGRWADAQESIQGSPYFFTTPQFETSDARYDWLNKVVAVGRGKKDGLSVHYSIYAAHGGRSPGSEPVSGYRG